MSQLYAEIYGEGARTTTLEMREYFKKPGKRDDDGDIIYFTEQNHKNETDINSIIAKFDKTGLITHVSKIEGRFGDLSGVDFKMMQDQVAGATTMFEALPADIRAKFGNDPANLLAFMDNADNRAEAIELGMIKEEWTDESDGLGEHVPTGENIIKTDTPATKKKEPPPAAAENAVA